MNPVALAQSFLMDIAAGTVTGREMQERARQLGHDLEPYRSAVAPLSVEEREGVEALRDFDFEGLARDVLITTIHGLARRLLEE